jgi:hypothetical protein
MKFCHNVIERLMTSKYGKTGTDRAAMVIHTTENTA